MSKWEMVKLTDLCNIQYGFPFNSKLFSEKNGMPLSMPLIRIRDVVRGFSETYTTEEYKDEYVVRHGDMLIGMDGEFNISKWGTIPALLNQRVCRLIPRNNIYSEYIFYAMHKALKEIEDRTPFVTVKHLSAKEINKIVLPLPPLATQHQIAETLDKVAHLIDLCNAILEKLDLLVKARFVEMFGNPVNNSYNFPTKTLIELGELGRGVSKHRPRNAPELLGGKYPLIQTGDVANADLYICEYKSTYSEIGYKQSKMWSKGTLCITIAANIAKTAILTFDSCFPDSIVGFNANNMTTNLYIHYWFTFFQSILEEQAPESAQKNINLKILSELKINMPPIELHNQFATFIKQIDKSKLAVKKVREKAETLKKALMQKYFE